MNLKNCVLIIDEIQNMVSEEGTYYSELYYLIKHAPNDLRIVLLSATPMFDKPFEMGLTINLLRPEREFPSTSIDFDKILFHKQNHFQLIDNQSTTMNALQYPKGFFLP